MCYIMNKLTRQEQREILNLMSASGGLIGFLSALKEGYIKAPYLERLKDYYISNLEKAVKVFVDKIE